MYLKLGDMYVESFNINDYYDDNYDNIIHITFTDSIGKATIFDNVDLYKRLIESSLLVTLKEEKAKESE